MPNQLRMVDAAVSDTPYDLAGSGGGDDRPPLSFMNGDDRGGTSTNNKPSLTITDAGAQLTRTGLTWAAGLGQSANVTFAFRSTAPTTMPTDTSGFTRFTEIQISATLLALQSWSDVANITFTQVSDTDGFSNSAVMLFGNYGSGQSGSAAFAYNPGSRSLASNAGDVWIGASVSSNTSPALLNYGQHTLVHEIGHAIGLSHPAAYNAAEGVSITYGADATYYEDSRQYTVMSYFSQANTGANFGTRYASAPLLDDIAAAQRLYGANMATRTGDTIYGFNSNADRAWFAASSSATALIFAIWDAGGTDTLDFSGYSQDQIIDLRQGSFSNVGGLTGNVSIALGAVIERAIGGSGSDTIYGSAGDNVITGGAGTDIIRAGLGSDTAVFSGARSSYTITYNGQQTTVVGPDGSDILYDVEFLRFSDQTVSVPTPTLGSAIDGGFALDGDITNNTINGGERSDYLRGLGGDDVVNGNGGNDRLYGGLGNDTLNGGDGDDFLVGGSGNDSLNGGAGTDLASYSDASGSVNINLATGVVTGADGTDTLNSIESVTGSAFADVIRGNAGDNVLQGNGGADTVYGGAGNDTLWGGAPGESGGAPDIVKAAATVNASIGTAISIDGGFDLLSRSDVANSATIPHATVTATSHGDIEYYAVTVAAGATVIFDIDGASFDSTLRILRADGSQLAENDDGGSDSADTDSQLSYTFAEGGTYYIQVAQWSTNTGSTFTTEAPVSGATYTLHVSVPDHSVVPVTSVSADLYGEDGDDTLFGPAHIMDGGAGNDTIQVQGVGTLVNGGAGDDLIQIFGNGSATIEGGSGSDTLQLAALRSDVTLTTANGVTTLSGTMGSYTLTGVEFVRFMDQTLSVTGTTVATNGPDTLTGTAGNDVINGLAGDDVISGRGGSDTVDGGVGYDTFVLDFEPTRYVFEQTSTGWRIRDGLTNVDTLTSVELIQFGTAPAVSIENAAIASFDAYRYIASYADLAQFRDNLSAAYDQYIGYGRAEGRSPVAFNALRYIASNPDLIPFLGTDERAASRHYVLYATRDGRSATSFDPLRYVASNPDLISVLGTDQQAASRHFILYAARDGRSATSFDALRYIASNADLIGAFGTDEQKALAHYINYGSREGRPTTTFDPLQYAASYADLARAFGMDSHAATLHYLNYGGTEGRVSSFDARIYAATHLDLAQIIGTDTAAATRHYLLYGVNEGRATTGFDAVAYLLSYGDLAGRSVASALDHWLTYGADEGRAGDSLFGREQTTHTLAGGTATAAIERSGDSDWFGVTIQAGSTTIIDVQAIGGGQGTLGDGRVLIYDSLGRLVGQDNDSGPGPDASFTFTATTTGQYYIVVTGAAGSTGTYTVQVSTSQAEVSVATTQALWDDDDFMPIADVTPVTSNQHPQDSLASHGSSVSVWGETVYDQHLLDPGHSGATEFTVVLDPLDVNHRNLAHDWLH